MEEPEKHYTHTIEIGKQRPGYDKELIDFLQSGRPVFVDLKSRQIIETKSFKNGAEETK